ncbi:hypothetical protein AB0M44_35270 [Streptosporangium subroseum]|uniref:hypothetical protein n=1 Tax=Streptosporangium subroseum TaxID=106412 RepID=UPI00343C97F3
MVRFEHASALAQAGEFDEAYRIAVGAVNNRHTFHSVSVVTRAQEFGAMLTPGGPAARAWREILADLKSPDASLPALSATQRKPQ